MLISRNSNFKLKIWLESLLTGRRLSPKSALFNRKIPFLWFANTGVKPPFFKICQLKLQKSLKWCSPNETESYLRWVISWNNFVRITTHSEGHLWNIAKSTSKLFFNNIPAKRLMLCQTWIPHSLVIARIRLATS